MSRITIRWRDYWPVALPFFWLLALILSHSGSFDLAFFGAPAVFFLWFLSAALCFTLAISLAVERAFQRALYVSIVPLSFVVALTNFDFIGRATVVAGDYVHVYTRLPIYLYEISSMPAGQGPKLAVFKWELGFFDGVSATVYDESDELLLPEHSAAWKERASGTVLECRVYGAPAGWHFYIVDIFC